MRLLLDTHLLLWAAAEPDKLSAEARGLIEDATNALFFSAASLWEVAITSGLGRPDFQVHPARLGEGLIDNGYVEIPITGRHAAAVMDLPPHHNDPFDRPLAAQATIEGLTLLTSDRLLAPYGPNVRHV